MGFAEDQKDLTVVFDKGMNSKDNIGLIDGRQQIHFITTYSTYFAEHLARLNAKYFEPLDIAKTVNWQLRVKEPIGFAPSAPPRLCGDANVRLWLPSIRRPCEKNSMISPASLSGSGLS